MGVYSGGCFATLNRYDFTISGEEVKMAEHLTNLFKYLDTIESRKDQSVNVHSLREDLIRYNVYDIITIRRNFYH